MLNYVRVNNKVIKPWEIFELSKDQFQVQKVDNLSDFYGNDDLGENIVEVDTLDKALECIENGMLFKLSCDSLAEDLAKIDYPNISIDKNGMVTNFKELKYKWQCDNFFSISVTEEIDLVQVLEDNGVEPTEENIQNFKLFLEKNFAANVREHISNEVNYFAADKEQWDK